MASASGASSRELLSHNNITGLIKDYLKGLIINMEMKKRITDFARDHYWFGWTYASVKYRCMQKNSKVRQRIEQTIERFVPEEKRSDKKYLNRIRKDIYISRFIYQIAFDEYFLFDFFSLSREGRKAFIGNTERSNLCAQIETGDTIEIFKNKYNTYLRLQPFYKRDVIMVSTNEDYENYLAFFNSHSQFMVKAVDQTCGRGIYRIDRQSSTYDAQTLFESILKDGGAVLEECIAQTSEMAKFHPNSVNTVRFATFSENGTVTKLFAFMRMGRGDSVVDNGGLGGILALIDIETGVVVSTGTTETGKRFILHPESGERIIGFEVPRWNELNKLVEELPLLIPEHQYISWDFALTDNGWVLVEANSRGQFVFQCAARQGCRELIESVFHAKNGKILK